MAVYNGLGNRTLTTHTMRAVKQMMRGLLGGPSAVTFTNSTTPTTGGGAHGVVGDDDLKVTAQGSPNMSVSVAPGFGFILQDANAHAGTGTIYNDAALTVNVTTAHATLARTDLIVARMRDNTEDAGGSNTWEITIVTGTAGSGTPTIPAGCLVLAQIAVAAAAASITNANITDRRVFAAVGGGALRVSSSLMPTGVARRLGQIVSQINQTARLLFWDGTAYRGVRCRAFSATGIAVAGLSGEVNVAQLNVADQGCDGTLIITVLCRVTKTAATDDFTCRVKDTTTTIASAVDTDASDVPFSLSTAVAMTSGGTKQINVTMQRTFGAGTGTTSSSATENRIDAIFVPT